MTGPQSVSGKPSIGVPRTSAMTPDRLEPRRRRRRAHANEGIVQPFSKQNPRGFPQPIAGQSPAETRVVSVAVCQSLKQTRREPGQRLDASRRVRRIFTHPAGPH